MVPSPSRPASGITTDDSITLPYKKTFPAAWIVSTAETRALDGARKGLNSNSEGLSLIPPANPPALVRESVVPAVLFIQQAGLASPAMSVSPTSLSSHKERKIDVREEAKHSAADQARQSLASKPNQLSERPSGRGTMKRLLPKFLSKKRAPKSTRTPKAEKRKASIADSHTLPTRRGPFIWPENPQNAVSSSRHNASGLVSVPEGSQVKLTEEFLGLYARGPMTAETGISSRSSNYADVPSRLPEFSPGYSPMA